MKNILHLEGIETCKQLGFINNLRTYYAGVLRSFQSLGLEQHLLQQLKTQLDEYENYSFSKRKIFDFEKAIRRTQKSIHVLHFNLIISRLDELLGRNRLQGDEAREGRLKDLWRSAITAFMAECTDL
jgi:wobble nucleotide-excising tRNase